MQFQNKPCSEFNLKCMFSHLDRTFKKKSFKGRKIIRAKKSPSENCNKEKCLIINLLVYFLKPRFLLELFETASVGPLVQ